uniref:Uncharacterized protein n=1 Tax=Chromera velia CCMP2878 TaxID=1169474 RepID=A0A0G4GYN8_9ALVE|eukprot:Cvel_23947.t1-p1 / transcript=Cvel_23947.t1 / gene=Cvel_23947 / organism=Chromera_velia_CCMP2878 / gene_product=hypothetical protein / transcript_product=hypothetical protein / location=Cvel_scaffold2531:20167-21553(-) / protein_length=115 / sequence_SO=supercontig / SO=protein_coding / is_pseudo=false
MTVQEIGFRMETTSESVAPITFHRTESSWGPPPPTRYETRTVTETKTREDLQRQKEGVSTPSKPKRSQIRVPALKSHDVHMTIIVEGPSMTSATQTYGKIPVETDNTTSMSLDLP